ncbi:MAG: M23 family metallopeptidase, partial [Thermoleophilia bacterium]|nr:M23 family metallopeptidase [Thermoleophilia bacterium]
ESAAQLAAATEETLRALEDSKDSYNQLRAKVAALQEEERKRAEEARRQEEARKLAAAQAAAKAAAAKATATNKTTITTKPKSSGGTSSGGTSESSSSGGSSSGNSSVKVGANWVFPVQGPNSFVDTFGAPRSGGRTHQGTDIMTARNTPIVAVVDGVILRTNPTDSGLGGITIWLKGDDGNSYYYAHLSSIA